MQIHTVWATVLTSNCPWSLSGYYAAFYFADCATYLRLYVSVASVRKERVNTSPLQDAYKHILYGCVCIHVPLCLISSFLLELQHAFSQSDSMPRPCLLCFLMEELSRREPVIPRSAPSSLSRLHTFIFTVNLRSRQKGTSLCASVLFLFFLRKGKLKSHSNFKSLHSYIEWLIFMLHKRKMVLYTSSRINVK